MSVLSLPVCSTLLSPPSSQITETNLHPLCPSLHPHSDAAGCSVKSGCVEGAQSLGGGGLVSGDDDS